MRVEIEDDHKDSRIVSLEDIEQRVQDPWKPRDLADNLVVFRRRIGRTDEYIEDLRVRRNVVRKILTLLTTKGFYRPARSVATSTIIPVTFHCPHSMLCLRMLCRMI